MMNHFFTKPARLRAAFGFAVFCVLHVGCGTNKFQQEVQTEVAAIKLAKETIQGKYELVGTDDLKKLIKDEKPLLVDTMPAAAS